MIMRTWLVGLMAAVALSGCAGGAGPSESSESAEEPAPASDTASEPSPDATAASTATTDEFVEQVLVECEAVNKATTAAEPKGDPFGAKATDEDRQQAIAFLSTFAESLTAFAANLEEAGYPEDNADAAQGLVSAAQDAAAAFSDAASVAEKDFAKAQAPVGKAFGSIGQVAAAAKEIGVGDLENCQREKKVAKVAAGANKVPVIATMKGDKYVFDFDTTVLAGKTAFVMDNKGKEPHFMAFVQLTGPNTLDKALAAELQGNSKKADQYIKTEDVGGSKEAAPGEQAVANLMLKPGTYGMLCFISGPDGKPHAFNGMAVEFQAK